MIALNKEELKIILFALRSDYETVANDAGEWPEYEPERIKEVIDKLERYQDGLK